MDKKYIRQFDNMFAGEDVILTITKLIRGKNKGIKEETTKGEETSEAKEESEESPFWSVE